MKSHILLFFFFLRSLSHKIQVATQIALIIAIIARSDFPKLWPQLLNNLHTILMGTESISKIRAMTALYHVIKVLASRTLKPDRLAFQQVLYLCFTRNDYKIAQQLFPFTDSLWFQQTSVVVSSLPASPARETELAFLSIKLIRKYISIFAQVIYLRLIVFGITDYDTNDAVRQFFQRVLQLLQSLTIASISFLRITMISSRKLHMSTSRLCR